MTSPVRAAGWGTAADGSVVTWTISQGRRGRRWREVVAHGDAVVHALLLETGSDGRFSHMELARADGLWTFHPEGDGTLHGNRVDRSEAGVRHVEGWSFGPDDVLVLEGSPVGVAAAVHRWRDALAVGASVGVGGVAIGRDGALRREDSIVVKRLDVRRWRIGDGQPFEVDEDGAPILVDGQRRPLEVS
ncbi:MAG: hypothetical protein ACJ779_01225 [Chloroflexota bacterium]